jgi:hypothetical protein
MKLRGLTTAATALALMAAPTVAVAADWRGSSPELSDEDRIELVWGVGAVVLALVVLLGILKNDDDDEVISPPPPPVSP